MSGSLPASFVGFTGVCSGTEAHMVPCFGVLIIRILLFGVLY